MTNSKKQALKRSRKMFKRAGNNSGYTLLEYAAGAAVLLSVVVVGLQTMGTNLSSFFDGVGQWASTSSNFQGISGADSDSGTVNDGNNT